MPLGIPRKKAVVVPYDPNWPVLFAEERRSILAAVGHIVESVHHVGSTSIPGMPSKPILDIAVLLHNFEDGERCISPMEKIGYLHVGLLDEIPGDRFFGKVHTPQKSCSDSEEIVTHHIHMYTRGSPIWHNQFRFRDYLIAHPEEIARYTRLKLTLGDKYPNDRASYSAAKNSFITELLAKAAEEFE